MLVPPSGDQVQNHSIPHQWSGLALGGFLLISIFALLATPVEAQCQRWDVSGNWVIRQANGINESVSLQQGNWQQQSAHLTGTAAVSLTASSNSTFTTPPYPGVVSGNITNNAFTLLIERDSSTSTSGKSTAQYRYTGTIGPGGKIEGTTKQGVHWVSSRKMKCADPTAEAPPVPQPPSSTSAASITANPAVVSIPSGHRSGTTTLTWDAGKDHPYAEVWVAVAGQDPTFVVEQGKGSRSVTVERGTTYRYILSDSGKDLSGVTVKGK